MCSSFSFNPRVAVMKWKLASSASGPDRYGRSASRPSRWRPSAISAAAILITTRSRSVAGHERFHAIVGLPGAGPSARLEQRFGARQFLRRKRRFEIDVLLVQRLPRLIGFRRRREVVIGALQRLDRAHRLSGKIGGEAEAQPGELRLGQLLQHQRFVDRDRALVVLLRFADFREPERRILGKVSVDLARGEIGEDACPPRHTDRASSARGRCNNARSPRPAWSTARRRSRAAAPRRVCRLPRAGARRARSSSSPDRAWRSARARATSPPGRSAPADAPSATASQE